MESSESKGIFPLVLLVIDLQSSCYCSKILSSLQRQLLKSQGNTYKHRQSQLSWQNLQWRHWPHHILYTVGGRQKFQPKADSRRDRLQRSMSPWSAVTSEIFSKFLPSFPTHLSKHPWVSQGGWKYAVGGKLDPELKLLCQHCPGSWELVPPSRESDGLLFQTPKVSTLKIFSSRLGRNRQPSLSPPIFLFTKGCNESGVCIQI